MKDLVEKPARADAPSNLAIIGRYILTPDIFEALKATSKDRSGEIQLTNGLRRLLASRPIYAYEIDGVRHDTGNKLGFLEGDGLLRTEAARSGSAVPRVSRKPQSDAGFEALDFASPLALESLFDSLLAVSLLSAFDSLFDSARAGFRLAACRHFPALLATDPPIAFGLARTARNR